MIRFIIFLILGYLVGSLSSAVIVCQALGCPDPRSQGSGNPGATNVLRLAGKKAAIIVLICDFLKGFLPVLVGSLCHLTPLALGWVALSAVLGHIFPVFFKFQGGKGIATAGGAIFAMSYILGGVLLVIWLGVAIVFRYSSLASLSAAACAPILCLFLASPDNVMPFGLITVLIAWRHKDNINRLLDGNESKIKLK